MRKLEELIAKLCPNGVLLMELNEVIISLNTGLNPRKFFKLNTEDATNYYVTIREMVDGQIVFSDKTDMMNDDALRLCNNRSNLESGDVLFSGTGTIGETVVIEETPKDWNIKEGVYTIKPKKECIDSRYLSYLLSSTKIKEVYMKKAVGGTVKSIPMSELKKIKIPVPPLPVQSEIVCILDNFRELTGKLSVELLKRREQYKYYSTVLFDGAKKSGVHSIAEVCHIEKGKTPIQKAIPGVYPMVVTTTERKSCDTYQFDAKAVCIPLVSSRGHGVASLNHVYYQEGKFALGTILCAIIPKNEEQVNPKYLYYYFEQTKDYTLVPLMKGGANVSLHMNDIRKVKVPIPSLEEQKRIVDILGHFDTLCNDISTGLPAEIAARQKQYEYYRDMLLAFQKIS